MKMKHLSINPTRNFSLNPQKSETEGKMAISILFSVTNTCVLIFSFARISIIVAKHSNTAIHHHHRGHHSTAHSNPNNLHQAYLALQAWKRVIYSDPTNFTSSWAGPSVCSYRGIFCAPSPSNNKTTVVAGIDLNRADIAGFLPEELGLLSDLALIHLNSNRFCGILPQSFSNLTFLYELDLSNNRFVGPFPHVILSLPSLKFLDLRYNEFEGSLPPELFNKDLDAIFINNNWFTSLISSNFSGSSASVVVFANNNFGGCLSPSIAKFADTLEELLLINTSLSGCLPPEIGYLYKLRVLDVSFNSFVGQIPYSIAGLSHLEQLNVGHNRFSGILPVGVCDLPNLANITVSYNFICEEEGICRNLTSKGVNLDDRRNCLPEKPLQRSKKECDAALEHPVECYEDLCGSGGGSYVAPAVSPVVSPLISPVPGF